MNIKNRILWIDTLKALGIFFIILGHIGEGAGKLYSFVYLFHVPLFFFLSGIFHKNSESIFLFIIKKFRTLIIPYFVFSIVAIAVFFLRFPNSNKDIFNIISPLLFGIRNTTFYAEALWFFPCLFFTSIFFEIINKTFKNKVSLLLVSIILFYLISLLPSSPPSSKPQLVFNIDSSIYYMLFYTLGYLFSDNIKKIELLNIKNILIFSFLSLTSIYLYINGNSIFYKLSYGIKPIALTITPIISLIIIYNFIFISLILSKIELISNVGKKTLVICGTESISKGIILSLTSMFGFNLYILTPFAAICFSLFIICVSCVLHRYTFNKYKYFQ